MTKPDQPNIVWIFLDQCRTDVLGCYGHPFVQTPNIDRLARMGVRFENAFSQNPVCVPSRSSILSGQYSHQIGVFDNSGTLRAEDEQLLHTFVRAGYHTANVGKIHVGLAPEAMGFQEHRTIEHDGIPHFHVPDNYPESWPWRTFDAPSYPQPIIYATDMCPREQTYCASGVDEAMDMFQHHSFTEAPLFLRLSLDRPHTPVSSPKPYDTMYAAQTRLPDFPDAERTAQIPTLRNYIHDRRWDQFTEEEILHSRSYYYGLVTHLDAEIGRLLDLIDTSPQRENTLIVLAADHGCMLGEHGLYVKCPHNYTEAARVPLIVTWPGKLPAGRRINALVELVDLLPTLCDLCELPIPEQAVGQSLVPLMRGDAAGRDVVFAEQYGPDNPLRWVAARTHQYAYTHYPNTGDELLFDLRTDAQEQVNLLHSKGAHADSAREVANALRQRVYTWLNNEGAK